VVLTAVAEDHAQGLGGIEGVAAEKARLAHAVRPGGLLVINGDDPRCLAIGNSAACAHAHVVRVGFGEDCEWRVAGVDVDFPRGSRIRIAGPGGDLEIAPPWIGGELARCAALAVAVGVDSGVGYDTVRERLAGLRAAPERLEAVPLPSEAWLLCDSWKSTWDTIESA